MPVIVDMVNAVKDVKAQKASVAAAWGEALALDKRRVERISEGLPEHDADQPFAKEEHAQLDNTFHGRYEWSLSPKQKLGDGQIGCMRREFISWSPTFLPASKCIALANSNMGKEPKCQTVVGGVFIDPNQENEEAHLDPHDGSTKYVLQLLELRSTTWAF